MDPTVTCDYELFQGLREANKVSRKNNGILRKKLDEALLSVGGDSIVRELVTALRASMSVVQFAQANLDPETIRGWPHAQLAALALAVKAMPSVTDQEIEWADDAVLYARQAQALENARKLGTHKRMANVPRGSMEDGSYQALAEELLSRKDVQQVEKQPQEPSP